MPCSSRDAVVNDIDAHLVSLVAPTSAAAEDYRTLRAAVERLARDRPCQVVAVSSPGAQEGKTLTAINLAATLAQVEKRRVLLLDVDLRTAALAQYLGLARQPGFVDIIHSQASLDSVVTWVRPNLGVVAAGTTTDAPYEVLSAPRLREAIDEARRSYDFVVLDTPPIVSVADCRSIADFVDGFIVVVAAHRTQRAAIDAALRRIDPAKLLGLVLNQA